MTKSLPKITIFIIFYAFWTTIHNLLVFSARFLKTITVNPIISKIYHSSGHSHTFSTPSRPSSIFVLFKLIINIFFFAFFVPSWLSPRAKTMPNNHLVRTIFPTRRNKVGVSPTSGHFRVKSAHFRAFSAHFQVNRAPLRALFLRLFTFF